MISEQDVYAALQGVAGPDGKTPLPETGAIAGVTLRGDKIYLSLSVAPEQAAALEGMRLAAEQTLRRLPGVASVLVNLTAQKPASAPPPRRPGPSTPPRSLAVPGVERIIAVASGKGGVGKSTTAVNLALGLASLGWRIGILDLDIYGPSLPRLLHIHEQPSVVDRRIQPLEAFGVKAMSIGFMLDEEEPVVWRGPMVMGAV